MTSKRRFYNAYHLLNEIRKQGIQIEIEDIKVYRKKGITLDAIFDVYVKEPKKPKPRKTYWPSTHYETNYIRRDQHDLSQLSTSQVEQYCKSMNLNPYLADKLIKYSKERSRKPMPAVQSTLWR